MDPVVVPKEPRQLRAAANETSEAFDALDRQTLELPQSDGRIGLSELGPWTRGPNTRGPWSRRLGRTTMSVLLSSPVERKPLLPPALP